MKTHFKTTVALLIIISSIYSFSSCNKKAATGTDKELYDLAKVTNGFVWYKNSDAFLSKSSGSGHSQPYLKTRYNAIAASKLDSNGKIINNASFAEGSLIVKELYNSSKSLDRYAILYKNSSSADADAKGWVWGYINSDGSVAEAASNKGKSCISCHTQSNHIDYMLMNKFFP